MADVFISYKREDRERASNLARELGADFSVFFDADIPVGDSWDQFIERELLSAAAVIVLWSTRSVASRWVRLEARHALQRGVLVPVMLEPCAIPLEFQDIQAAELVDSNGVELGKLVARVKRLCGAAHESGGQRIFPTTPPRPQIVDTDTYTNYLNYGCGLCETLSELLCGQFEGEEQLQADRLLSQLKRAVGLISGASDNTDTDMIENIRENVWEAARLLTRGATGAPAKRVADARDLIDEAAADICWLLGYRSAFETDQSD
ncbi:MAG: toll/interleukin-1 receptor domain-containing protein [Hyphomonadaceae bacterium]